MTDNKVVKKFDDLLYGLDNLRIDISRGKSEAIKEFTERLKEEATIDNLSLDGKYYVYVEDIDNLVKEMTEV